MNWVDKLRELDTEQVEPLTHMTEEVNVLREDIARNGALDCVLVDEAQFLTKEQVWQLANVVDKAGIPVVCYGLRTDFQGELFPGAKTLLGIADSLIELKAVCHCGRKSSMNLRVDESGAAVKQGAQTEIGGNDRYVALCRKHFTEALGW